MAGIVQTDDALNLNAATEVLVQRTARALHTAYREEMFSRGNTSFEWPLADDPDEPGIESLGEYEELDPEIHKLLEGTAKRLLCALLSAAVLLAVVLTADELREGVVHHVVHATRCVSHVPRCFGHPHLAHVRPLAR